jgi:hypothetical protein
MQEKFELFDYLPPEIQCETAQHLLSSDLISLAMASKKHWALFKPMLDVRQFLYHVTRGEHEAVVEMLKLDITLIFKKGQVTDCSGRTFAHISAFEYTLWALDKHMWTTMLGCIPRNDEGNKVLTVLSLQYDEVNTKGVIYRLHGKIITEKHFDFANTIIKELNTFALLIHHLILDDVDEQWKKGVGGAQKLLPMHVVYEYCSHGSFLPMPNFTPRPKSSKQFYNCLTKKDENWFSLDSKLGVDFAIFPIHSGPKGLRIPLPLRWIPCPNVCIATANAMMELCKVRSEDFINLKSELEERIAVNNQVQSVGLVNRR